MLVRTGKKAESADLRIALAGNPNTGKSTVFNYLTGLRQHTGNWPGKTVAKAEGSFVYNNKKYDIVDLPGTYSLLSTSEDEEIARDFILFGSPDVTLIVSDATRLERNLNLILQILEITDRAILIVNLIDEAQRNGISVDTEALSKRLSIPVVGASARSGEGMDILLQEVDKLISQEEITPPARITKFQGVQSEIITSLTEQLESLFPGIPNARWLALRLLDGDEKIRKALKDGDFGRAEGIDTFLDTADRWRWEVGEDLHDHITEAVYAEAQKITEEVVTFHHKERNMRFDIKLDRILTSKIWGFPIMLLMLATVLWLTIKGSNYPSQWLSDLLVGWLHPLLKTSLGGFLPTTLVGFLVDGVYLTTAWVVSVMLPPMAIFFPLFTLLEDFGYLPRVAFNLDELFRRSGAHGKQALTMTMGFGCNAAGVVATRIIDSPRERLIAILTNNFSLCNGRWPTQIMLATIFISTVVPPAISSVASIGAVLLIALLGILMMFLSSLFLSHTMLKGTVSTFNLELPPYRPPKILQVLYTSLIDRTLIVLWRAIMFAAPAGAFIWLLCNIMIGDTSIAEWLIESMDGFGLFVGLNGVILLAYIIAIPANEIVIPTVLMLTILSVPSLGGMGEGAGVLVGEESFDAIEMILRTGGWTTLTAVNVMLFSLLHNPCSTTIYTIYKETGSIKWTIVSVLLPLVIGFVTITAVTLVWRLVTIL
ncbi:ferrous iron transport protein B [Porphyromonas sp.]|uniref:ferrous iron transport protein B n=1 Tax=Porphyromonas sp. TaxID=1924944 RepID=UPI0026DBF7DF|nr:ferrous iron transport protein B [Porphyromonas sp.]MDO4770399.1 ferrous iron transport protein B [Porphyromonas sp.]